MPTKEDLEVTAQTLISQSLRVTTRRTYNSAQKRFFEFCVQYKLSPLPATEEVLLLYVAFLYEQKLKYATVQVYLSAIRSLHIFEGYDNPLQSKLRLKQALRAFQIQRGSNVQKLPITAEILEKMYPTVLSGPEGHIIWAAMTLAFFGCLRCSEFTIPTQGAFNPQLHLCLSDMELCEFQDTSYISVFIKRSKTDKFNKGFYVYLSCTDHKVCAYCALKQLMIKRVSNGNKKQQPLFIFFKWCYIVKTYFCK